MPASRGSAPVEFVLVAAPLVLLSLSVIGLSLNAYATNVAQDVAVEAASYGSLADANLADSQSQALKSLRTALGSLVNAEVQVFRSENPCETEAMVTLRTIPLGFLSSTLEIEESAIEICELQF